MIEEPPCYVAAEAFRYFVPKQGEVFLAREFGDASRLGAPGLVMIEPGAAASPVTEVG